MIVTSPLAFSSDALDDDARRVALVGVFELIAEVARIAEIKLGADFCGAQLRDHVLIVGEAILVEHGDDHRAGLGFAVALAEVLSAAASRDTPMENPVAGTGSPRKRETRPS